MNSGLNRRTGAGPGQSVTLTRFSGGGAPTAGEGVVVVNEGGRPVAYVAADQSVAKFDGTAWTSLNAGLTTNASHGGSTWTAVTEAKRSLNIGNATGQRWWLPDAKPYYDLSESSGGYDAAQVDLGVTKTHSRPHVSNDNPFSEAHFKTLKYRPGFPQRFGCLQDARGFCGDFFGWYNQEQHHAGLGLLTPHDVHHGLAAERIAARAAVLAAAYAAHPERFPRGTPKPQPLPNAVWINNPARLANSLEAAQQAHELAVSLALTRSVAPDAPAPARHAPHSGTAAPALPVVGMEVRIGMQGEAFQPSAPGLLSGRGPDVHLRPAQPLRQGGRLVRLQRVLGSLCGQGPCFLQQAQRPMTHHPQQLRHLTLRGRRQRLEAHAALPRHEDAVHGLWRSDRMRTLSAPLAKNWLFCPTRCDSSRRCRPAS